MSKAKNSAESFVRLGLLLELILPVLTPAFYWVTGISCALIVIASVMTRKPESTDSELKLTNFFFALLLLHAISVVITALCANQEYSHEGFVFFVSHYKIFLLIIGFSLLHTLKKSLAALGQTLEMAFWTAIALLVLQLYGDSSLPVTRQIASAGMMFFTVPNDATYLVMLGASAIALSHNPGLRMLLIPTLCTLLSIYCESRLTFLLSTLAYLALLQKMRLTLQAGGRRIVFAALPLFATLVLIESNLGQKISATVLLNERISLWWAGLAAWPGLFGEGVGSFLMAYEEAKATGQIPAVLPIDPRPVHWAHNIFVEAFCERGGVALVLILLLAASITARIVRRCSQYSDWSSAWPLAMFLIVSNLEASLYNHPTLAILALLICLATLPHCSAPLCVERSEQ